ncbi:restriction endonuclease subunit S [Cohnella candidum]|uniref:restriction endonuclease subunit S n=1 Tax=Cohnella candidum TaxID=2674991 RepID=UPI001F15584C|nr:restriction endonuclease subunit S [Cohnella candidum]
MIEAFWNICLLHDISSRDQLLREAIRVIRTKQLLKLHDVASTMKDDPDSLFSFMKEKVGERELGHFPGDRDLFFKLFHAGERIDLLEYAMLTLQQDRVTGGVIVHPGIMERFIQMCLNNNFRSILIPEAEKFLRGLLETKIHRKAFAITLLTENYVLGLIFKTYFKGEANIRVLQGSIYQPLPLEDNFDAILTFPNLGVKLNQDHDFAFRESEGIASIHLLGLLREGGRMSATYPARMMFQSGTISDWRKEINKVSQVCSIHSLPDGILRPYTSVKVYQVDFGTSTKDVVLGQLSLKNDNLEIDKEITIHNDQFAQMYDWRIEVLLNEDQETLRLFQQAPTPKVKLREIAEYFRGKSVLKQDLRPGKIKVVNISNIENGEVNLEQLETIDEEERKIKRYEILPDDLIMTCRGTVFKLAVFPEAEGVYIASANIIVIRFRSKIISRFAKIFLESPTGEALVKSFMRGTTVINLNPSDVGELEIPLLSHNEQLDLITRYSSERERYKSVIREADERWERTKNQIYSELY